MKIQPDAAFFFYNKLCKGIALATTLSFQIHTNSSFGTEISINIFYSSIKCFHDCSYCKLTCLTVTPNIRWQWKLCFLMDQSRKGDDRPIIANSKIAAVLESIEGLFSRLTWWSDWKVSETHFLAQNWAIKSQTTGCRKC